MPSTWPGPTPLAAWARPPFAPWRAGCDLLCLGTNNTDADLSAIESAVGAATLGFGRVEEAAGRVRALADDLAVDPPVVPEPDDAWPGGPDQLIRSFDVQPAAAAWRDGTRVRSVTVVRLEARPNSAAGPTPWGPPRTQSEIVVSGDRPLAAAPIPDGPILVVGQDIHRHAFARAAVDRLRAEHPDVLVVDMGWPSPDRHYADVATFGASALIGRALLNFLRLG